MSTRLQPEDSSFVGRIAFPEDPALWFLFLPLKSVGWLFDSESEKGGNNPISSVQLSEAFLKACLSPLVDLDWEKIAFNGSAFGNHRLLPNLSVSLICPDH
ncbi:hypothetical protein APTSU1_001837000 [Apodemus speciosus]|uniref:Uncharacterized protein n=1 Tax=Apodemus speciosus TaxID=105296 RepID=A0ABQ0FV70_APOSI